MALESVLFWIFAVLALAGAAGLIVNRSPIYSALSLILNFFSIAGLYLSLRAEFLAVIQVLVYAGAIMVLFLFVIMLLNLSNEPKPERFEWARGAAFIFGFAFVFELLFIFSGIQSAAFGEIYSHGKVEDVGFQLMTAYLFPFEIISVVLLAALIGAIVIARKYDYN